MTGWQIVTTEDTLARIEALAHEWRHSPVPGSGFYGQSLLNELARDAIRTTPQPAQVAGAEIEESLVSETEPLPYVTTSDGRKWSTEAVQNLKAEHDALLRRRDALELELAQLRGKIHLLDREAIQ